MSMLIIIVGLFALFMGILILIYPENIFSAIQKNVSKLWLHILAVVSRLLFGGLLIYYASSSKFPFATEVIGWLAIIAGFFLLFAGRRIFVRIVYWAVSLTPALKRLAGIFSSAFGAFLIYAYS